MFLALEPMTALCHEKQEQGTFQTYKNPKVEHFWVKWQKKYLLKCKEENQLLLLTQVVLGLTSKRWIPYKRL